MADVSSLRRKLQDKAEQACLNAVIDMIQDLKSESPVLTGETRDSIDYEPINISDESISYRIVSPTPQGQWVEEGTSPHDIYGNPYLAWVGSRGPVVINASRTPVHHPGTSPKPWFHPVTDRWNDYLRQNWN